MTIHYQGHGVTLHHGDCLDVLRALPDASVDSVVTDPPYGLEFMGKDWDGADGFRRSLNPNDAGRDNAFGRSSRTSPEYRAGTLFQEWAEAWSRECLRVLKPGGHLLAFGGTRTWHRLACAVEDAGFEVRDSIAWMYGSGFPKSLDVSKAIDKRRTEDVQPAADVARWLVDKMEILGVTRRDICDHFEAENIAQQWTTHWVDGAVKPRVPRWEQWQELRRWLDLPDDMDAEVWRLNGRKGKPGDNFEGREVLSERVTEVKGGSWAAEVATGRFRLGEKVIQETAPATDAAREWEGWGTALKPAFEPVVVARKPLIGTVAANVTTHGTGALNIDGCRVEGGGNLQRPERRGKGDTGGWADYSQEPGQYGTPDGQGRWPANVVLDESQAAALDEQSGDRPGDNPNRKPRQNTAEAHNRTVSMGRATEDWTTTGHADIGGASRFFYVAKADASERPRVNGTAHPTVKPLDLMRWLVRLVTPPGGTVLEPFAGSGTTVEACIVEGFQCIAIEREADYLPLIRQRIDRRRDPVEALRGQAADLGLFDLLGGEGA